MSIISAGVATCLALIVHPGVGYVPGSGMLMDVAWSLNDARFRASALPGNDVVRLLDGLAPESYCP